jgi:hypothetical protein
MMKFAQAQADIFVPDGGAPEAALARLTHLAIGAHQDDLEIIAHHGIVQGRDDPARAAFGGVVVTNGAGSARSGPYADRTDAEMQAIRRDEQRAAARLGHYAIQIQLAHPSAAVKQASAAREVVKDLEAILALATPSVVYLHNPADKHDTHVGVLHRCLAALRGMPPDRRPEQVLGVEVWRGLDWMVAADKVALDDSAQPQLRRELLAVFDSQIAGGKRYDAAVEGRRAANATFNDAHSIDEADHLTWAMDLTPVVDDPSIDLADYTLAYIDRLKSDVADRISRMS